MGLNEPSAGSSCFVSGWCPVLTPAWMSRIEMNRAKTCAVVMNSRVDAPGRGEHLLIRERRVADELDEVAVGEHAALGAARGARRVDERGDVGAVGEVAPPLDLVVGDVRALGDQPVEVAAVHLPGGTDERQLVARLREAGGVLGRLGDDRDRPGVGEVPRDLTGRAGLVDRHHHGAGIEQREVDQRPVVGGAGDEADLVARLDAAGDEPLREGDDLLLEFGRADVAPPLAIGHGEQCTVGRRLDALDQQVGDIGLRFGGDDGRDFELDHGSSFGTGRMNLGRI